MGHFAEAFPRPMKRVHSLVVADESKHVDLTQHADLESRYEPAPKLIRVVATSSRRNSTASTGRRSHGQTDGSLVDHVIESRAKC